MSNDRDKRSIARIDAEPVARIFSHLTDTIRAEVRDESTAVDLELTFENVDIKRKGIFFSSNHKQTSTKLRLVTRVRKQL